MNVWHDKVVIVTGASSGLGRWVAAAFAAAGAKVVLAARRRGPLDEAAKSLEDLGHDVLAVPVDVTNESDVRALIELSVKHFGRIDVLVNNVGRSARGALLDTTPEQFEELIELNLLAAVRCTREAAPMLIEQQGSIVNIASLAAKSAARYLGAYPASKFALAAYTQQLRLELAPQGVHVMLVCSGPIARDDADERYQEQTEGLPASAAKPGAGVKAKAIAPEVLAQQIVKACEQRRPEIVVPSKARWLFALSQLWPTLGDKLLLRMTGS